MSNVTLERLRVDDAVDYCTRRGEEKSSRVVKGDPAGLAVELENGDVLTNMETFSVTARSAQPVEDEAAAAVKKQAQDVPAKRKTETAQNSNDDKASLYDPICIDCEKPMPGSSSQRKYCNDCRKIRHREYMRKQKNAKNRVGEVFKCPDCGRDVKRVSGNQKRCKDCSKAHTDASRHADTRKSTGKTCAGSKTRGKRNAEKAGDPVKQQKQDKQHKEMDSMRIDLESYMLVKIDACLSQLESEARMRVLLYLKHKHGISAVRPHKILMDKKYNAYCDARR